VRLSRITSGGRLIPEIDGLRFAAITSVVAFHVYEYLHARVNFSAPGILNTALLNGQRGVPLFFVISGFILGRPFASHYIHNTPAPKLKEYFLRRFTRLEPPYLVALFAVFFGLAAFTSSRGVSHLLASVLYSHNLIYGSPNPFYGLAWSLEIEIQFYCLLPLLAFVYCLPRIPRRSLLAVIMLAGAFHLFPMPTRLSLSFFSWIQYFAAGTLLADLYIDGWNHKPHWRFDLASLVLWPTVFLISDGLAWVALPAIAVVLYASAFRSIFFQRVFTLPAIVIIGGMCYTIYLVHYPVVCVAGRLSPNPIMITALSLAGISAASLIFFVLIERPCMDKNWPSQLFNRNQRRVLHGVGSVGRVSSSGEADICAGLDVGNERKEVHGRE